MAPTIPTQAVVVSDRSYQSDDTYAIIGSNISFVNALFEEYFYSEEISTDALRSYYVDYYLAQFNNGGFSQFVYNSRWNKRVIEFVCDGLQAMNAVQHLAFFQQADAILSTLGPQYLEAFITGDYFGENEERDALSELDEQLSRLNAREEEDLIALNAAWLRQLSHLVVLPVAEMEAEIQQRSNALPDREERIARALENEPDYFKLIRALCAQVGQELSHVTIGDPTHQYAGESTLAWHFITDQGHHYMIEVDGKALMFQGKGKEPIAEINSADYLG